MAPDSTSDVDVERIAEAAAEKAVEMLFAKLGIQSSDPFAMQRDMAFLREWRQTCELIRGKGMVAMLTVSITGLIGLLVLGFKQWLQ
jgi:hypothetical protein